jgi:hypothetical protein
MSNFLETTLAATIGVTVFYLLESIYYDIKARIRGREHDDFWDFIEEEFED